jgi:iron complex outermembrane receptor protein/vitamin B12 transporter
MFPSALALPQSRRFFSLLFSLLLLLASATGLQAASVRGVVTDATGARVPGARVSMVFNGKVVASVVCTSDGSFQLTTGEQGRMFLLIAASGFRQISTPDFYAGRLDSLERNLVLEPQWARESIVVTATGIPTPQPQVSESTTVLDEQALAQYDDLAGALRQTPGAAVVQTGQMGSVASIFVRGGNSTANKVLIDGIDTGDLGGYFNFGTGTTSGLESAEIYRGADSSLYGADAGSSVISLRTPHGTTNFPSVLGRFDGGNLNTTHDEATVAGAWRRLDYLTLFSWLQTANDLPNDAFHAATTVGNFGYQLNGTTQLRGTLHYGVTGGGIPNSWDFYQVADNATQKDQNLLITGAITNQTTPAFKNTLRYGAARKREESNQWNPEGTLVNNYDGWYDDAYFGKPVVITGANGYQTGATPGKATEALLDATTTNNTLLVNNRDELNYQGDYRFTPHLAGLIGFRYENERGVEVYNSYWDGSYAINDADSRTNYTYLAAVQGDFKNRFNYHLGGSLEHYSLFGTQTTLNAGLSYYVLRPRSGHFNGTRIFGTFGNGVREPKLTDKFGSLYYFLQNAKEDSVIQQFNVKPLAAPTTRSYEAGFEQVFLDQHLTLRSSYFHNEFGKELESLSTSYISLLFPNDTASQLQQLKTFFNNNNVFDLMTNTQAFRAQGIEATLESGIGSYLFLRAGYTYTDAVVQRSFSSDNEALLGGYGYSSNGIALGAASPLVGARPFRRPPHSGYFTATYAHKKLSGVFSSAFASRSDDSTFLEYSDATGGNSLLLPNRNLDHGFAKLGMGGSYQAQPWLVLTLQMDNLLNQQHIAPIGYPSLPMTVRSGIRIQWGPGSGK